MGDENKEALNTLHTNKLDLVTEDPTLQIFKLCKEKAVLPRV